MNNVYGIRILVTILLLSFFTEAKSQLVISSGFKTGSYYQMANDIKSISKDPIEILTSEGSLYNFNAITSKDSKINVAFMQSDVLMYKLKQDQETGSDRAANIRILLELGIEEVHLITTKTSSIESIKDLKKRKVAVGSEFQGTAVTSDMIKEVTGIKWVTVNLSFDDAFTALVNGEVDAFFFVGAAPVSKLAKLSPSLLRVIKLIPIEIEMIMGADSYTKSQITAEDYYWMEDDISTIGVKSFLVADIKNESIEDLQKLEKLLWSIKKNMTSLQMNGHSQWENVSLKFEDMKFEVHPSAKKIFATP